MKYTLYDCNTYDHNRFLSFEDKSIKPYSV